MGAVPGHHGTDPKGIGRLFSGDAFGGILLIGATLMALLFSNSVLSGVYNGFLGTKITVAVGAFTIDKPLLLWINDGLMAVFFLLVGLELKREVLEGELSDRRKATLPVIAALGGILVPALIYVAFNAHDPAAINGWAIPAATDIAFAMGILALLGSRVPVALKVFLLAVAIIDDLAAIIIIALFYTAELSLAALAVSVAGVAVLAMLNARGVSSLTPYVLVGIVVWAFLLKSGVHATLAGVVTALFVPHKTGNGQVAGETLLSRTEHDLKPWVLLGVMPLFAFANAGVALWNLSLPDLVGPVSLGIALGLFIGKQAGIMASVWLAVRFGLAKLPNGVNWQMMHGAALLAGIGFTMSLFIGTLAFPDGGEAASVRVGVLVGSICSGVAGYLLLRRHFMANETASSRADQFNIPAAGR